MKKYVDTLKFNEGSQFVLYDKDGNDTGTVVTMLHINRYSDGFTENTVDLEYSRYSEVAATSTMSETQFVDYVTNGTFRKIGGYK